MNGRVLGALAVFGLIVLVIAWQLGLLTPEPDEVNLADAVATQTETDDDQNSDNTGDTGDTTDTESDSTTSTVAATSNVSQAPCAYEPPEPVGDEPSDGINDIAQLDGRWLVRQAESTFAGYRIDEILSGADFTAVGRSSGVGGSVTIAGGSIDEAQIAVDLVGLTSDSRIRDEQLKRQALETTKFPTACFSLSEPIVIDALPADGDALSVDASGSLHIHGVDQPVTIALEATVSEGLLFVVGSTDVALADFDIEKPSAPSVADVSDTAVMEFSLVLSG